MGNGDVGFRAEISRRVDPTGPGGRDLWCWHLPNGVTEFHGIVAMTPLQATRREYMAALTRRFGVTVAESDVHCPEPKQEDGNPLPPPLAIPEPSREQPAEVNALIPQAAVLECGQVMLIPVPIGGSAKLRNALIANSTTRDWRWSVTRVLSHDPGWRPEFGKDYIRVCKVDLIELRPSPEGAGDWAAPSKTIQATERVEHKIETRITERSVTVSDPTPPPEPEPVEVVVAPLAQAMPPLQIAPAKAEWPESFLPADGEDAREALDLIAEIAALEVGADDGAWEVPHTKLWDGVANGVRFYRDAKATTDRILMPWLAEHWEFEVFGDMACWDELAEDIHAELYQHLTKSEEVLSKQRCDLHEKNWEYRRQILKDDERTFYEMALKFFAKLTEEECKLIECSLIGDKELPALARKILAAKP